MTKKAEVVIVADNDDELRTSVSENPATTTLYTEESLSGLSIYV
jgi:hypothetical protein